MEEEKQKYKDYSLSLAQRLLSELDLNKDTADEFFGGEIYRAYAKATEAAMGEVRRVKNKIQNL